MGFPNGYARKDAIMSTKNRSAVTGRYVTEKQAARNPREHVREHDKPAKPSPTPKKGK